MGAMDATDIPRDGEVSKDPSALYYGVAPMPPSLLVAVFCAGAGGGGGREICGGFCVYGGGGEFCGAPHVARGVQQMLNALILICVRPPAPSQRAQLRG